VSNKTSSALHSAVDLGSIPMAQGGLARLAIARLEGAGVPMVPLLRDAGLTPELMADPEEHLSNSESNRAFERGGNCSEG